MRSGVGVSEVVGLGTNGLLVDDWIRGRADGYGAWSLRRSVGSPGKMLIAALRPHCGREQEDTRENTDRDGATDMLVIGGSESLIEVRGLAKYPSHGGSQGFKSPHLHPTTALVTGLAGHFRRAAAVPRSLAGQQTGSNRLSGCRGTVGPATGRYGAFGAALGAALPAGKMLPHVWSVSCTTQPPLPGPSNLPDRRSCRSSGQR